VFWRSPDVHFNGGNRRKHFAKSLKTLVAETAETGGNTMTKLLKLQRRRKRKHNTPKGSPRGRAVAAGAARRSRLAGEIAA